MGLNVHDFIGREPSGGSFNSLTLNEQGLPHNPLINAGAIMACTFLKSGKHASDRLNALLSLWKKVVGNDNLGFDNCVCLSEKRKGYRNQCLSLMMHETGVYENGKDMNKVRDFKNADAADALDLYGTCLAPSELSLRILLHCCSALRNIILITLIISISQLGTFMHAV